MPQKPWLLLTIAASLWAADINEDLLAAARSGDVPSMQALLDKGAAIETTTPYGQTPLFVAAMNGHEPAVQLLLQKGAKSDVRDTFYKMPVLDFVLARKHFGVAKALIEKGSANADDNLRAAAGSGRPELVRAVLDRGKPTQAALDLHYEIALDQKRTEIAEQLRNAGARPPAAPFAVDAKVLASYVGTYRSDQFPLDVKIFVKEGKLAIQVGSQPDFSPKAKSVTVFHYLPQRFVIEFDSTDTFTVHQGKQATKFKKAVTP